MKQYKTLEQIAAELMHGCPSESREDHETIADAIRGGVLLIDILGMPEVNRWPETCAWLISKFKTLDAD